MRFIVLSLALSVPSLVGCDPTAPAVRSDAYEASIERSIEIYEQATEILEACTGSDKELAQIEELKAADYDEAETRKRIVASIGSKPSLPEDLDQEWQRSYKQVASAIFRTPESCI